MDYKVTDTELTSIADAIRTKGCTSLPLTFPQEFIQAIDDIPSGGGSDDNFKIAMGAMSGSIYDAEITSIRGSAFAYNGSLINVEMTSVSKIGAYAFYACNYLEMVSLPLCESINNNAFGTCGALREVYAPLCKSVDASAFWGCGKLQKAIYPSCTSVDQAAFYHCSSLSTISFPVCARISQNAFGMCDMSEADFPVCSVIDATAFGSCPKLQRANFPSCKTTGISIFINCKSLVEANFPEATSFTTDAFGGCLALTSIYAPKCSLVGTEVFKSCCGLPSASFPACEKISASAFYSCSSLSALYLLASSICSLTGSNAFYYTPMSDSSYLGYFGSIYVPSSLVDSYKSATNWSYYSDRIVAYSGESYYLQVTSSYTGGTVTGDGYYYESQPVTITATPNSGYTFSKFKLMNGGITLMESTVNPWVFPMYPMTGLFVTTEFSS